MGGFRNGTTIEASKEKDGTGSLLLDPQNQTYSDAPFSRLWRPEYEYSPTSASSRIRRFPLPNWRILSAFGIAIISLLLIWFFILSPVIFRREKNTEKPNPKGHKEDKDSLVLLHPIQQDPPENDHPTSSSLSMEDDNDQPMLDHREGEDGIYISAIHNLPPDKPLATIHDASTSPATTMMVMDSVEIDRMELPDAQIDRKIVAKFEEPPHKLTGILATSPATTTTTTKATTKMTSPTTTESTTTTTEIAIVARPPQLPSRPSSAPSVESTVEEEDDDGEEYSFWMERKQKQQSSISGGVLATPKNGKPIKSDDPRPRPTITHAPVEAIHRPPQPHSPRQEDHRKVGAISTNTDVLKSMRDEELDEIVREMEEERGRTLQSSGGSKRPQAEAAADRMPIGGEESVHHDDEDVRPVIIPFDFPDLGPPKHVSPGKADFDAVWRRPPPGESGTLASKATGWYEMEQKHLLN